MRLFFFVAFLWATLFGGEISVFESIENANNIKKNGQSNQVKKQSENFIKEQISNERAQGILSVVEGQNQQISILKDQILTLQNRIDMLEKKIADLSTKQVEKQAKKDDFKSKKKHDILKEADQLYKSKKYPEAKDRYEFLATNDFKPAYSNYMIGEINYFQKLYANAIKSYQTSLKLHDKADYMPRLLYHSAISFDKLGDIKSANQFYNALMVTYPDSKEAQAVPKNRE